jgi:hypothetical protein
MAVSNPFLALACQVFVFKIWASRERAGKSIRRRRLVSYLEFGEMISMHEDVIEEAESWMLVESGRLNGKAWQEMKQRLDSKVTGC